MYQHATRYKAIKLPSGRYGVKDTLYKYNVSAGQDIEQAKTEAQQRNIRFIQRRDREQAEENRLNGLAP